MSGKHVLVVLMIGWLELGAGSLPALGDGGTLRFSGRRGDLLVTVFTAPGSLRAGPIDLSVLVQNAKTGRPITDLSIDVHVQRIGYARTTIRAPATQGAATNKLLRAARLDVPESGRWHFDVSVQSVDRSQPIGFDAEVSESAPLLLQLCLWIGWPLLPIGLFGVHQLRMRRRSSSILRSGG
jgi:hypothetical protein